MTKVEGFSNIVENKKEMILLIIIFAITFLIYMSFQFVRINKVAEIRTKWIYSGDFRYWKYTFGDMCDPSIRNWFGLKIPKECHYAKEEKSYTTR